ncbi:hypothetical protein [Streptomyces sp. SAJ15]|uniref:hypothetical protein n=1 Tax=Streptomyces sp. SAJ15 TaxID=2011095 RepID=UPI001185EF01|nr:hypothetical protein [Streptomyces sp. SAJ15]TVL87794.1 hypothetical protein CD790_32960 [Streptomyces sp. SAJ15]
MIVRCHQIISPATGKVVPEHPGIRVGADYPVLEIMTSADRVLLRIPERLDTSTDRDSPGLWDAAMFTVVSERMPSCWVAALEGGSLTLAPPEWQRPGFWEDYFDAKPAAVAEYDRRRVEIITQA